MPFETVLTDGADRARVARLSQIVLSVFALYIALVGFAIVMSGWRVDELSAPLRSVAIFQPALPRTRSLLRRARSRRRQKRQRQPR